MINIPSNIVELLNKYSDTKHDGSYLNDYLSRVSDAEPVIPVLGMQGMGKSTLINALLEENILPNEADETTCVPVEIKYGEKEYADVLFKDSKESKIVNTIEELRDYVDNNYNSANEKGVLKIILYRKKEILKSGVVIVDLPGVGSLTAANEETTNKYIQNLCTAIFVIPTVPTIRKNEALFIKAVWSQFSKAIFVQNDFGESKIEIAESVEYNAKLLRGIAEGLNNKFEKKDILVINAYNAIDGTLKKDSKLRDSSNISALTTAIDSFATNWKDVQSEGLRDKTAMTIDAAIIYAKKILQEFTQSQEESIRNRESELRNMQSETNKLEEEVLKVKSYISQQEFTVRTSARTKASECVKKLRAAMNKTIDSGVYDGDALTNVFNDEQQEKVTDCLNSLFDEITNVKIEIDLRIQHLCEVALENDMIASNEEIHKKQELKYEKGIDLIFRIGGGIGGYLAYTAVGAAIGGPVGAAIGFSLGLVVGVLGSFVGSKFKRKIHEKRAAETKRELEPYYEKIESVIKKTISEKFNSYADSVKTALEKVISERRKIEMGKKESLYVFEDVAQVQNVEKDIEALSNFKNSL
jgi:GTPase SAR1 family protein